MLFKEAREIERIIQADTVRDIGYGKSGIGKEHLGKLELLLNAVLIGGDPEVVTEEADEVTFAHFVHIRKLLDRHAIAKLIQPLDCRREG